ncbi:MAG: exodeoxyribonuclease VII small subunit [Phycisphaerales bacterium]|nr:exodeoxyribonuclease VII small subunit [Phycisphaerales bacterium]
MTEKPLTFEAALQRLEKLTVEIERGEIGLEDSITRYEEGMKLLDHCRQMLAAAEQRIQKLTANPDGTLNATDAPELGKSNRPAARDD